MPRLVDPDDPIFRYHEKIVGGRPPGCPHAFCGCEASRFLFGKIRPELNLAANWIEKFPRAAPAPGMAAARRGHVMVLLKHVEGRYWLVHDGNSGDHLTRVHVRSISGYTVVNPKSTLFARRMRATQTKVAALPRDNVPLPRPRIAVQVAASGATPIAALKFTPPVQTVAVPLPRRRIAETAPVFIRTAATSETVGSAPEPTMAERTEFVPLPRKRTAAVERKQAPNETPAVTEQSVPTTAVPEQVASVRPEQAVPLPPRRAEPAAPKREGRVTTQSAQRHHRFRARHHHRRHGPSFFDRVVRFVKNL